MHEPATLSGEGFVVLPGVLSASILAGLALAYDKAMEARATPDFNAGSTTDRLNDLVSRGVVFEPVYTHPALIEHSRAFFAEPFRLNSLLARTLRPETEAQPLHTDLPRGGLQQPLLGFIWMLDAFLPENGATRFVPGSQRWPDAPGGSLEQRRAPHPREVLACGAAGSLILFNAAIWHGHTANRTPQPRRSIQGYLAPRRASPGTPWFERINEPLRSSLVPAALAVLDL